jgi:hypothetical protein
MVGLQVWDKLEDWGLQAKLALQTARGDPRAVDTALELQLERLDNVPGNATAQEVIGKVAGIFSKKRDEAAQIAASLARLGAGVDVGDDGLIHVSPGTAQDAIDDAVEELRRLTGRKVWASGNSIYISSPSLEAVETAARLQVAARTGGSSATIDRLIEEVAAACSHGSGDRVVLGAWRVRSGYIGEAIENGGIFFDTSDDVWRLIEESGIDPWEVNEAFLRRFDREGLPFEFTSTGMNTDDWHRTLNAIGVLNVDNRNLAGAIRELGLDLNDPIPFRLLEIQWLLQNGYDYTIQRNKVIWYKP